MVLIVMAIAQICSVSNFLKELTAELETMIYYSQRFYLLIKGGQVQVKFNQFKYCSD